MMNGEVEVLTKVSKALEYVEEQIKKLNEEPSSGGIRSLFWYAIGLEDESQREKNKNNTKDKAVVVEVILSQEKEIIKNEADKERFISLEYSTTEPTKPHIDSIFSVVSPESWKKVGGIIWLSGGIDKLSDKDIREIKRIILKNIYDRKSDFIENTKNLFTQKVKIMNFYEFVLESGIPVEYAAGPFEVYEKELQELIENQKKFLVYMDEMFSSDNFLFKEYLDDLITFNQRKEGHYEFDLIMNLVEGLYPSIEKKYKAEYEKQKKDQLKILVEEVTKIISITAGISFILDESSVDFTKSIRSAFIEVVRKSPDELSKFLGKPLIITDLDVASGEERENKFEDPFTNEIFMLLISSESLDCNNDNVRKNLKDIDNENIKKFNSAMNGINIKEIYTDCLNEKLASGIPISDERFKVESFNILVKKIIEKVSEKGIYVTERHVKLYLKEQKIFSNLSDFMKAINGSIEKYFDNLPDENFRVDVDAVDVEWPELKAHLENEYPEYPKYVIENLKYNRQEINDAKHKAIQKKIDSLNTSSGAFGVEYDSWKDEYIKYILFDNGKIPEIPKKFLYGLTDDVQKNLNEIFLKKLEKTFSDALSDRKKTLQENIMNVISREEGTRFKSIDSLFETFLKDIKSDEREKIKKLILSEEENVNLILKKIDISPLLESLRKRICTVNNLSGESIKKEISEGISDYLKNLLGQEWFLNKNADKIIEDFTALHESEINGYVVSAIQAECLAVFNELIVRNQGLRSFFTPITELMQSQYASAWLAGAIGLAKGASVGGALGGPVGATVVGLFSAAWAAVNPIQALSLGTYGSIYSGNLQAATVQPNIALTSNASSLSFSNPSSPVQNPMPATIEAMLGYSVAERVTREDFTSIELIIRSACAFAIAPIKFIMSADMGKSNNAKIMACCVMASLAAVLLFSLIFPVSIHSTPMVMGYIAFCLCFKNLMNPSPSTVEGKVISAEGRRIIEEMLKITMTKVEEPVNGDIKNIIENAIGILHNEEKNRIFSGIYKKFSESIKSKTPQEQINALFLLLDESILNLEKTVLTEANKDHKQLTSEELNELRNSVKILKDLEIRLQSTYPINDDQIGQNTKISNKLDSLFQAIRYVEDRDTLPKVKKGPGTT